MTELCKDITHNGFKRTLIYHDTNTQSAKFRANPLCQATKRPLNNSQTVKNHETEMRREITSFFFFGLSCCFPVQCLEEFGNRKKVS